MAELVKTEIYPGTQWLCKSFQLTVTHKSEKIKITKHTPAPAPAPAPVISVPDLTVEINCKVREE